MIKQVYLIFAFIILLIIPLKSASDGVYYPAEKLEYEVSFMGITLGWIKIHSLGVESLDGKTTHHVKAFMDSRDGIPFVDLHAVFMSWVDPSLTFTHQFVSTTKYEEGKWDYQKIMFDHKNNMLSYEIWREKKKIEEGKVKTPKKYNDGSSLFFFARKFTDYGKTVKVPTIMNNDTVVTILNFHNKIETVEIDAIDYPVETIYFDGKALWSGIYGLNGEFEGWFTNDDARVPVKAHMNVYVGKVLIELVKWERGNWVPPKAL